jgi:hypothetical protein
MVLDTVGPLKPDSLARSALEHGLFARRSRYNSRALMWRKLVGRDDSSAGIGSLRLCALLLLNSSLPLVSKRIVKTIAEISQTVFDTSRDGNESRSQFSWILTTGR